MLGICLHKLRDSSNLRQKIGTISIKVILEVLELFKQAKIINGTAGILQLTPFIILG